MRLREGETPGRLVLRSGAFRGVKVRADKLATLVRCLDLRKMVPVAAQGS